MYDNHKTIKSFGRSLIIVVFDKPVIMEMTTTGWISSRGAQKVQLINKLLGLALNIVG